jgi:hypothetical protein
MGRAKTRHGSGEKPAWAGEKPAWAGENPAWVGRKTGVGRAKTRMVVAGI